MKTPKISVIVGVYNTEKYLKKCLDSILNQTYKNLELILVEDGSKDNCKEILKSYEKKKNVKVIYNPGNKGLSYSRNVGLEVATGQYIGYIDSDDYINSDYYEKLFNALIENDADVSIGDMKIVYEESNLEIISRCYNEKFSLQNVINTGLASSACNKLFKRELIEKYPFAEGKVNEDIAVIIPALVNATKIAYAEKCYYYYVQRNSSLQNSSFSVKRFDIFYGVDQTLERIKGCKSYKNIEQALVYNQLIALFIYVIPKEKNIIKRRKILKIYNSKIKKYDIKNNKYLKEFLANTGKKHSYYYRMLLKFNSCHLYTFSTLLILAYDILSKILKSGPVIESNIDKEKVISSAIKQSEMSDEKIKVSAVIPNYNYSRFLYQRIFSVLNQDYKIHELIILDDCSIDDSQELIDDTVRELEKYIKVRKIYNEKNSGSAFNQWKKGFEEITGDYIWIAEADDYCDFSLLSSLIKPILKEDNIVISYCDTSFIDPFGNIQIRSIKPEIDIRKTGHWDKSYINDGLNEIKNYSYLNCTIANVSGCIIKKGDYKKYLTESGKYRQAGDWLFYVNVMSHGKVSYINKSLNYYRLHGENISSTMNQEKHLAEINKIHAYYVEKFSLNKEHKKEMAKRIKFLRKTWKLGDRNERKNK